MAYDERLAQLLRDDLAGEPGYSEMRMFGGLCFLVDGNMVAGCVDDKLMLRVGADAYDVALARPHAAVMDFTGRPMRSMIYVTPEAWTDNATRRSWLDMSLGFVRTLPPKPPKKAKPAR